MFYRVSWSNYLGNIKIRQIIVDYPEYSAKCGYWDAILKILIGRYMNKPVNIISMFVWKKKIFNRR